MSERPPRSVALVTGAGRGIGVGIAQALAQAGLKVALADVDRASVEQEAAALRANGREAVGLALDVVDAAAWSQGVAAVVERWGGLDVLVNNAGISPRGTAESTDEALWDRTLAINLKGPWLGIKTALPWLRQRAGAIVNIGSTRATRPLRGLCAYCSSKAGLVGLTQQVAIEYLDDGVTSNMVAPGWVDTPGERVLQARYGRPDFPAGLRKLTTPDEVGAAVVFLASEPGRKVNGVILYLDAGLHVADDVAMVYRGAAASPLDF
ncbi:MAG TPA: SDR family oxidoreductase [Isosphaeraceae bacterium]|jgi:3-oxoacyl-[acyl-carrier protein] reductase|nr:SDR family oxidoreductase [Isosphaeraceae bacterium]